MKNYKFGATFVLHTSSISGGALAKILETTCHNIFTVHKFCKKCTCKIGDFKIMKHVDM
jgi:hypothetical protein